MVLGLMELQRGYFAAALNVFKGGTTGTAEIRRLVVSGTTRDVEAAIPPETANVHYEALDSEGADALGLDLSGTVGRRVWFDSMVSPAVGMDDVLIFAGDDSEWQVQRVSEPGNNSPTDSVAVVRR